MTNYPIGDYLVQLKNAVMAKNREISVRETKLIKAVSDVMKSEGFLEDVSVNDNKLTAKLALHKKEPLIMDIKLVSRPGLRVYMSADELEAVKGPSVYLISTPKGILTTKQAVKARVGGEVIVEIW